MDMMATNIEDVPVEATSKASEMFTKIDRNDLGQITKNDWFASIKNHADVATFLALPQELTDNVKDGGSRKQIQIAFNEVNDAEDIELTHFLAKYRGLNFQYGINTTAMRSYVS